MKKPIELVGFPDWKKGDGPLPFVFEKMPPGHKCAWTCIWLYEKSDRTAYGFTDGEINAVRSIGPDRMFSVDEMSLPEMIAEISDYALRDEAGDMAKEAAQWYAKHSIRGLTETERIFLPDWIRTRGRAVLPSYVWGSVPPNFIAQPKCRPGWPFPKKEEK